jgi:hypothetical protein
MDSRNGTAFRGVSLEQDTRYQNKLKKEMKQIGFSKELDIKINFSKVKMVLINKWIEKRVGELMGMVDEVLIQYIFELLSAPKVDPKELIILLRGFLENNAKIFVEELWGLLISAQGSPSGIPREFLDKEKDLVEQEKKLQLQVEEELKKQRRDRERMDNINREKDRIESRIHDRKWQGPPNVKQEVERRRERSPPRRRHDSRSPPRHRRRSKSRSPSPARGRSRSPTRGRRRYSSSPSPPRRRRSPSPSRIRK